MNGVHTLVFVQGSRAWSCGKRLWGHRRENTFCHNSGLQLFKKNSIFSFSQCEILRHRGSNFINGKCLALYSPSGSLRLTPITRKVFLHVWHYYSIGHLYKHFCLRLLITLLWLTVMMVYISPGLICKSYCSLRIICTSQPYKIISFIRFNSSLETRYPARSSGEWTARSSKSSNHSRCFK